VGEGVVVAVGTERPKGWHMTRLHRESLTLLRTGRKDGEDDVIVFAVFPGFLPKLFELQRD
jgi:hypothetical protein